MLYNMHTPFCEGKGDDGMERKIHGVLHTIQVLCITVALMTVAYCVIVGILSAIIGKHPTVATVIGCEKYEGNEYYTVTVEDNNGDIRVYYDYDYKANGEILNGDYIEGR